MLRKANNVFSVILDDVTVTTTFSPGDLVTDANLPKGGVVLVDLGNEFIGTTAFGNLPNGAQYRIVQGKGTGAQMMKSPVLTKGKTAFTIAKHKAAVQQITAIGYNGTIGALPTANNTDFWIKIRKRDNDAANRSQPMSLFAGPVRTDATGTQAELASMLVKNGYKNFKNEPANQYLKFEALASSAGSVPTTSTGTTTFTTVNGSRTVAINGNLTNVVVNDYIRLEGVATTNAVYKVVAYTAGVSIVLDSPFTGVAAAYPIANVRVIAAATAMTANFGVRLTGIPAPFNVNTFRDYYANRFTATFSDSTVPVTHLMGAYNGNGVWQQVAMDEYMSYGFEGENQQLATPSIARDQDVKIPGLGGQTAATSRYSALNIAWEESVSGLVSMAGGKGNVVFYVNLDSAGALAGTASTGEILVTNLGLTPSAFNA
jgi:hypothetical protein